MAVGGPDSGSTDPGGASSPPASEQTDGFSLGGSDEDCSVLTGDDYDICYAANKANDTTCDDSDGEVVCTDADGTEVRVRP